MVSFRYRLRGRRGELSDPQQAEFATVQGMAAWLFIWGDDILIESAPAHVTVAINSMREAFAKTGYEKRADRRRR